MRTQDYYNQIVTLPDGDADMAQENFIMDMAYSVSHVENLLGYEFNNKSLIEEALTHPSFTGATSYQRLEFVGDAALGLAISNFAFLTYPDLDPGQLSLLRSANVSTEKLARVAVRHELYKYVRHNASSSPLGDKVREFVNAVEEEGDTKIYGGSVKAPKVLADIVEAVAAALYVDCNFDLKRLWMHFRALLEPIVTPDMLQQQPQPVTLLFELCQREGKHVDIKHWRNGERNIASVYIDGKFIVSGSSEQKEGAKLQAAKAALQKLSFSSTNERMCMDIFSEVNGRNEIEGAKQKLHEVCGKKKWSKPTYRTEEEVGAAHERRFICSCQVETVDDGVVFVMGEERSRVKEAENSAASMMLLGLQEAKYLL